MSIFRWTAVRHGWVSFELHKAGGPPYRATVGDSTDVFKILIDAVSKLLGEGSSQIVSFDNEPGELRWELVPQGGCVSIRVALHSTWGEGGGEDRWTDPCVDARTLALDIVSSMEELRTSMGDEEFRKNWLAYPFPETEMESLMALIRS